MAELSLLLLTALWGTTFSVVKGALDGTSPAIFLALRFGVASLAIGAFWIVRRDRAGLRLLRDGALLGATMLGGFALQTYGLVHTTPARSGFLTGFCVLLVPLVERLLFRRAISGWVWGGVGTSLVGLALLTRPFSQALTPDVLFGDLLTLGCAVSFAFQVVLTSRLSPRHPLVPLTFVQIFAVALGGLLLVPFEPAALAATPALAAAVLFTGLGMTAAAFVLQNWAQRTTSSERAALIYALEPVAAALFAWAWRGEALGPWDAVGGALVVLAVFVAEAGPSVARRRAA